MNGIGSRAETEAEIRLLEQRLAGLEAEFADSRLSAGYGRFYAPLAVVTTGLGSMPLLREAVDVDTHEHLREHSTLWDLTSQGVLGMVGLLLVGSLVVLLCLAAARVRSALMPVAITAMAVLALVMLVGLAGLGIGEQQLSDAGVALMVAASAAGLVGASHAVHLLARQRDD